MFPKTETSFPPYHVTVWAQAGERHPYQDGHVIARVSSGLRIAVVDGVTPSNQTPTFDSLDGAQWATRQALAALSNSSSPSVSSALGSLARQLWNPLLRSRDQTQVTLSLIEIPSGYTLDTQLQRIRAVRAADSEVWVKSQGSWQSVFPGDMLVPSARNQLRAWLQTHPSHSKPEADEFEEVLLNQIDQWQTSPLGRFPTTLLEQAPIPPSWESIVLSTDGARLNLDRVENLAVWLDELRSWETTHQRAGDDVTVVRLDNPLSF